jgi:hypothetical protein
MGPGPGTDAPDLTRFGERYPIRPPAEDLVARKLALIAGIGRADSIRDFGGIWGVNGRYLLEGARALGARHAEMVDYEPTEAFLAEAERAQQEYSISVEMKYGDFRDPALYERLQAADVSLLYDVLLHQDTAVDVVRRVAARTRCRVCVAQPVLREDLFGLPGGCVSLILYPQELKEILRYGNWARRPAAERFETGSLMWGQTVSYLTSVFYGYGWRREHLEAYEVSAYWVYALMRFAPAAEVAAAAPSPSSRFADVPADSASYAEIAACARAGIAFGYPDGRYRPDQEVTRAGAAVFVARALARGEASIPDPPGPPSFPDVPTDHWAFRHVEYLRRRGVICGDSDGSFLPLRVATRGELLTLISRALGTQGDALEQAGIEGLDPRLPCTREFAAVCIARSFGLLTAR